MDMAKKTCRGGEKPVCRWEKTHVELEKNLCGGGKNTC